MLAVLASVVPARVASGRGASGIAGARFPGKPRAHPTCILDPQTLRRAVVQYGDDERLWEVLRRAEAGRPIVIAAIGGSVTQGAWATTPERTYVNRVFGWWRAAFPNAPMTLINAGIGRTDSLHGNKRLERDLLRCRPDFVITEWANNDAITLEMRASYRRLLTRILAAPSRPAVLMLFAMGRDGSSSEDNQVPVGRELGLPMVSLREAILPIERSGRMDPKHRTADAVHPNDLGHRIIARLVVHRLQSGLDSLRAGEAAPSGKDPGGRAGARG
ncbi:SGNH/GDSL hydrolase family protein [Roseomonas sp. M0104]|uniref:SGNH/GDSL hydrolase family protein n=2 Tax=Teichococcus coralli TaxID=2545983 RepID=A0A845BD65_9PROT|nr:SGNH/GDSL hydrolase family protein [Pseudoroseomonas coralli]